MGEWLCTSDPPHTLQWWETCVLGCPYGNNFGILSFSLSFFFFKGYKQASSNCLVHYKFDAPAFLWTCKDLFTAWHLHSNNIK